MSQTDWPQLVALYDALLRVWPSPVVALNRTVPLAMAQGPEAALAEVERLERDDRLAAYHYLPAIKADLLGRLGRTGEAAEAYRQALALTGNEAERVFLAERLAAVCRLSPTGSLMLAGCQAADERRDEGLVGVLRVGREHQALELECDRAVHGRPDLLRDLQWVGGRDHAGRRGHLDRADQCAEAGRRVLMHLRRCRARAGSRPRT